MRIGSVHPQCLQGICACIQKEPRALHSEEVHIAKAKSTKEGNHILDEIFPRETRKYQPASQGGYGEGNESCIGCTLLFILGVRIVKLEILEVWEETDEMQDLSARASWLREGEEPKCGREVAETLLNVWHKAGYLEIVYSELLEVRECRKVTECTSVELIGGERGTIRTQ